MRYFLYPTILSLLLLLSPFVSYGESFDDYRVEDVLQCTTWNLNNNVSVGDTNSQVTFTKDTKAIYIENSGSNELYYDPTDGIAVANGTGGDKLEPGESRSWNGFKTRSVGVIASSGESTTAKVVGCY